uniref:BHLH domain-containing protein n=1 Tax=Cucumis melo TaxID=3656 RepID=A0A9I9EH37_CUCME
MDAPSHMVNNYGWWLESKLMKNDGQLKGGGFTIPYQHPITHHQDCNNGSISITDNHVSPHSIVFPKKLCFLESELNANKHDLFVQRALQTPPFDLPPDYKRIKLEVPIRRSQKLSDKITALQKLVSPYGKTDTASVLEEACLYIKFIQHHIQGMYLAASSKSYRF